MGQDGYWVASLMVKEFKIPSAYNETRDAVATVAPVREIVAAFRHFVQRAEIGT